MTLKCVIMKWVRPNIQGQVILLENKSRTSNLEMEIYINLVITYNQTHYSIPMRLKHHSPLQIEQLKLCILTILKHPNLGEQMQAGEG